MTEPAKQDAQNHFADEGSFGLYVHIPYCRSRCRYCDFYTASRAGGVPEAYIDALLRDFARLAPKGPGGGAGRPASVYFGGGTPSLLAPGQLARLLEQIDPLTGAEITMEANPESACYDKLAAYYSAGANRLSVGVQCADDGQLAALGRAHSVRQAQQALHNAGKAGFGNLSGDLMLGLPGQTDEHLRATLELLRAGGAQHISAYLLKIEPGTPFGKAPPAGLPTADEAARQYLLAVALLSEAGYAQYEISNFARPGFGCRHNLRYWNCEDYLGIGPAAHSCLGNRRFATPADTGAFVQGGGAMEEQGACTGEDYLMLRLRLAEGLDEAAWRRRFGGRFTAGQTALLGRCEAQQLAQKRPEGWALTPKGMLVQNSLLAALLAEGQTQSR